MQQGSIRMDMLCLPLLLYRLVIIIFQLVYRKSRLKFIPNQIQFTFNIS